MYIVLQRFMLVQMLKVRDAQVTTSTLLLATVTISTSNLLFPYEKIEFCYIFNIF